MIYFLTLLDDQLRNSGDNAIEEQRDSEYDAMLSKMVGRIQTKPGGKLEMGEVSWHMTCLIYVIILRMVIVGFIRYSFYLTLIEWHWFIIKHNETLVSKL